jgi:hypothetical protein
MLFLGKLSIFKTHPKPLKFSLNFTYSTLSFLHCQLSFYFSFSPLCFHFFFQLHLIYTIFFLLSTKSSNIFFNKKTDFSVGSWVYLCTFQPQEPELSGRLLYCELMSAEISPDCLNHLLLLSLCDCTIIVILIISSYLLLFYSNFYLNFYLMLKILSDFRIFVNNIFKFSFSVIQPPN